MTDPQPPRRVKHLYAWLVVILFDIVLLVALFTWKKDGASGVRRVSAPPRVATSELPTVRFTDITTNSGIRFAHQNGAAGEKLLPETMGGGVGFLDVDADGDPDLILVNSTEWTNAKATSALFLNDGKGQFTDATAGSGLDNSFYGMGIAAGDFDNDGRVDLFLTGVNAARLLRNEGHGKFRDITASAGLASATNDWSTSAAWIDYNNDGRLDLFVCNYVQWSREIDLRIDYQLPGIGRAYGPPMNFDGTFPRLYRNAGHGKFVDVSAQAGLQVKNPANGRPAAKSLGVAPVDLDADGWMDLIVANDTVQNFVFHNEKNGTFREVGARSGIGFDPFGSPRGAMGIDSGRFQENNSLGVSIGNFANEMTALYVSKNDPLFFADEAITQGVGNASRTALTFGVFFFDYDLDGWLDLLISNGHIEPEINKAYPGQRYAQAAQLFWNARGRRKNTFVPVPESHCGKDLCRPVVGRGSAFADIDSDGDLDVIFSQVGGSPVLLRNDQRLGNHWLRVKLEGTKSNRDAIGSWVTVRAGNLVSSQQVMPTRSYLSQSELTLTFGLGSAKQIDSVSVRWADGAQQTLAAPSLNKLLTIRQQ